ncbi:hypothetical protein AAVH_27498 [Aphelenchoides avenae]|nr:hypothetical protein AAVH_27498 [Aphelenchus avenae]
MDWDDQGLPEELVKEQGELRAKVADLELKLAKAESLASSYSDKLKSLDMAKRALGREEAEVNDQRVKDLDQQLTRAQSQYTAAQAELSDMRKKNKDLQDLVDAYVQKDGGGPSGRYSTVDEHLWALGFVRNSQGQLQRTAAQGFNVKQQYTAPSRYGYRPPGKCSGNAS